MMNLRNLLLPLVFIGLACGVRQERLGNKGNASATIHANALVMNATMASSDIAEHAGWTNSDAATRKETVPTTTVWHSGFTASFALIQMADPQFGMKNMAANIKKEAEDFKSEKENLELAVSKIIALKQENMFVVMSGDMQNSWSQRGRDNLALGEVTNTSWDYGKDQALAVKGLLEKLTAADIPVVTLPGNHDLDDEMKMTDLARYKKIWRPLVETSLLNLKKLNLKKEKRLEPEDLSEYGDYFYFWYKKVMFIAINSQLYYNKENKDKGVNAYREGQTNWIKFRLKEAAEKGATDIVVLTHIPPSLGSLGGMEQILDSKEDQMELLKKETSGWANWHPEFRSKILRMMFEKTNPSPQLFLCGHFHGNVRLISEIFGKKIEFMTTSSVGASMNWEGGARSLDTRLTLDAATNIAQEKNGALAFVRHIIGTDGEMPAEKKDIGPTIAKRITTDKHVSGLRIVEFSQASQSYRYRHKWFTLDAFSKREGLSLEDIHTETDKSTD